MATGIRGCSNEFDDAWLLRRDTDAHSNYEFLSKVQNRIGFCGA
ncbi:hypothetical protein EDE15_3526 [Edaphobacter aggregans]|uniref:Uncharacterized protein n=1 Tax=Edaphobacter aggregans TaxID=570835 RepID=A0A3R9QCJ3_9BACT|nr:hypothetical protein EDE15_3526 [Edaphobacter aggregans]